MSIFNFNQFIGEKLGVSKPSIQFTEVLEQKCYDDFLKFLQSSDRIWNNQMEKVPYKSLRPYIKDKNIYKEFPVIEFELVYLFRKFSDKEFHKKYPTGAKDGTLTCGGWAPGFGNKNWKWYSRIVDPIRKVAKRGLIIQIGIEVNINKDKFNIEEPKTIEKLKDDLGSAIWHELNHVFEHYQRTIKHTGDYKNIWDKSFNTSITMASFDNKLKFPRNIFNFWYNNFIYFVYKSELFELRSNVQEMAFFFKKHPDKDIKEFQIYKDATKMEGFDAYGFYHRLLKEIGNYESYKGSEKVVAENLKKMWVQAYKKQLANQKGRPIIPMATLEKMDCLEFLRYWGEIIKESGTYTKKKIFKLKHGMKNEEI